MNNLTLTPAKRRKMVTDGLSGRVPLKELSRSYHFDLKTLKRLVRRAGLHGLENVLASTPMHYTEDEKREVVRKFESGVSQNKLALEYNVGPDVIRTWRRRYGKVKTTKKSKKPEAEK